MQIKNKSVLVTGANKGIGKALVQALLERGAKHIYAAARNPDSLAHLEDHSITKIKLDITKAEDITNAAQTAGDIDILINNAGAAEFISAFDGPMDKIHKEMNVNYFGTLAMMRAFIPVLEKKDESAIINVASIAAFVNFPFLGSYCASKAALFSITQGARIELAPKRISVHSVNPGPIDTDMGKEVEMDKTSPEETATGILDGFEAGEADIFPDPIGRQMFETWRKDYRDLEAMVAKGNDSA